MTLPCTFGCAGPTLTADERALLAEAQPWGFILFARNVDTPRQLMALTSDLREAVGREAPILIDQEGGRVQRMGPPHWRQWRPPLDQMRLTPDPGIAARAMRLRYRLIAEELRAVGIDVNCAPLADIARPVTHPILRNRLYGGDHVAVVGAARAVAQGLIDGGVLPVLKHIPGHGRATLDSHLELPRVDAPRAALDAEDFAAFRALADLPLGMSAHIVFEDIDPEAAATVSPTMIALIREEIGFDGLLMTDDISMQALSGDVVSRAFAALEAGCDIVLHCNGDLAEMEALARRLPPLSAEACRRTERALGQRIAVPAPASAVDIAALEAELEGLLGQALANRADG
ncbi:MAG: glycoside hydrolase family 3 N-terminal domain-containing protein [Pseudomonadota bacterium]